DFQDLPVPENFFLNYKLIICIQLAKALYEVKERLRAIFIPDELPNGARLARIGLRFGYRRLKLGDKHIERGFIKPRRLPNCSKPGKLARRGIKLLRVRY